MCRECFFCDLVLGWISVRQKAVTDLTLVEWSPQWGKTREMRCFTLPYCTHKHPLYWLSNICLLFHIMIATYVVTVFTHTMFIYTLFLRSKTYLQTASFHPFRVFVKLPNGSAEENCNTRCAKFGKSAGFWLMKSASYFGTVGVGIMRKWWLFAHRSPKVSVFFFRLTFAHVNSALTRCGVGGWGSVFGLARTWQWQTCLELSVLTMELITNSFK